MVVGGGAFPPPSGPVLPFCWADCVDRHCIGRLDRLLKESDKRTVRHVDARIWNEALCNSSINDIPNVDLAVCPRIRVSVVCMCVSVSDYPGVLVLSLLGWKSALLCRVFQPLNHWPQCLFGIGREGGRELKQLSRLARRLGEDDQER